MRLILFKQVDYRDNDLIVNGINENNQRISFLIKGAKKPNSKSAAYCILGNEYNYICDQEDIIKMHKFKGGELLKSHHHILDSLLKIACFNCLLELTDKLCKEDEIITDGLYKNLAKALDLLEKDAHELLVLALFMAYACEQLGIKPAVDKCVECDSDKIVALSVEKGGFICQNHHESNDQLYKNIELLKQFRYINKASFENYEQLCYLDVSLLVINCFNNFLNIHGAINLNSYEFLTTIVKSAIN